MLGLVHYLKLRVIHPIIFCIDTVFCYQLDCRPACNPDQSKQSQFGAAMSTTALPKSDISGVRSDISGGRSAV